MIKLEDLQPNAAVRGILPDALATVVSVQWFGSEALELTYKTYAGRVARTSCSIAMTNLDSNWSNRAGRGASMATARCSVWSPSATHPAGPLFDPVLAVHTSVVDPLPHQITAVY